MAELDKTIRVIESWMKQPVLTPPPINELYDALELLKEQKAIKRTSRKGTNGFSIVWTCGACGSDLHPNNAKAKYCSNCGQAVKWE